MKEIKKILYPVSFQKYTFPIFEKILELKHFGLKEVILLYFVESYKFSNFISEEFISKIIEDWKKLAVEKLMEYEKIAKENGIQTKVIVLEGNPRWQILKIADENKVDAIITGFQGDALYTDCYLDANSELILRSCKYPAFVFRGSENINPENGKLYDWRKILFPTDFSEFSLKVMDYLPMFPKGGLEKIEVIHIQDENLFKHLTPDTIDLYYNKDEKRMKNIKQELEKMGFKDITTNIYSGTPHMIIIEEAKKVPETLIIMGSRGKSASFQMLFGSTTERVARMSKSPILII